MSWEIQLSASPLHLHSSQLQLKTSELCLHSSSQMLPHTTSYLIQAQESHAGPEQEGQAAQSLQLENARLRAEVATASALECSRSMMQAGPRGDPSASTAPPGGPDAGSRFREALAAKDELLRQLQGEHAAARRQVRWRGFLATHELMKPCTCRVGLHMKQLPHRRQRDAHRVCGSVQVQSDRHAGMLAVVHDLASWLLLGSRT